ncbi:MAG: CDGSH iron-sulfur domain-containing protein [Bacteroidales bacterium]|jgi:CDGSH-type Zn-finger protein|nr:CDGSH iron-sulfur domain-containing protein [Bacteroidales bacterium]
MSAKKTLQILKNGPYLVSADVVLKQIKINPYEPVHVKDYDTTPHIRDGYYALCRCGHSRNAPFCDGNHAVIDFIGKETASTAPYAERAEVMEGETMNLLDDDRCVYARFCHRKHGSVWDLMQENDGAYKEDIIEGASLCPAGRLTAMDIEHGVYEKKYEPQIIVAEDPQKGVSAGLFVQGSIAVIGADGTEYEVRNRVALCRCGNSENKPFCDATHVSCGYRAAYSLED